jgi:hypothetical protein
LIFTPPSRQSYKNLLQLAGLPLQVFACPPSHPPLKGLPRRKFKFGYIAGKADKNCRSPVTNICKTIKKTRYKQIFVTGLFLFTGNL